MQAHLPDIDIRSIAHRKQRYPTVGDYYKKGGKLNFRISKMNWEHEFLVLLHELVEWALITKHGISIEDIDRFDIEYEKKRPHGDESEPGDDPRAPYFLEHKLASNLEEDMAKYLGVNWEKYSEHCLKV